MQYNANLRRCLRNCGNYFCPLKLNFRNYFGMSNLENYYLICCLIVSVYLKNYTYSLIWNLSLLTYVYILEQTYWRSISDIVFKVLLTYLIFCYQLQSVAKNWNFLIPDNWKSNTNWETFVYYFSLQCKLPNLRFVMVYCFIDLPRR